jgi:hypothetical protein
MRDSIAFCTSGSPAIVSDVGMKSVSSGGRELGESPKTCKSGGRCQFRVHPRLSPAPQFTTVPWEMLGISLSVCVMSAHRMDGRMSACTERWIAREFWFPARGNLRAEQHTCSRRRAVSGRMCDRSLGSALVPSRRHANMLILPSCLSLNRLYTLSSRAL